MYKNQQITDSLSRRIRLSSGEIALAVAVTVAAASFLIAALAPPKPETAEIQLPIAPEQGTQRN